MVGLAFLYLPGCACDGPVISVLDLLVLVRRVGPHKLGICWVLRAETGFLELTPFRSLPSAAAAVLAPAAVGGVRVMPMERETLRNEPLTRGSRRRGGRGGLN